MVTLITKTLDLEAHRKTVKGPVGFVPTMGNLHAGHISLLEEALKSYSTVYFSIFVNPKQFGVNDDFNRYPRTLENDIELIKKTLLKYPHAQVIVYSPSSPEEVFPPGSNFSLSVDTLSTVLEGKLRPGHFDGVATVVYRLFDLTKPEKAYFGLKDFQQYLVIKQMVKDLALPIEVIGMPTVREESGLALSSRNQYLSSEQKEAASFISRTLKEIVKILDNKRSNLNLVQNYIQNTLKDSNWNYLELRDADNFSDDLSKSQNVTILAVYQMDSTRLLDNMQVEIK